MRYLQYTPTGSLILLVFQLPIVRLVFDCYAIFEFGVCCGGNGKVYGGILVNYDYRTNPSSPLTLSYC